jgi:hypothetical protein
VRTVSRPGWVATSVFLLLALFALPASASAHERRTIGNGKYDVSVGWDIEPTFVGLKNSASIRISQAGSDPPVPVDGVEKTLKVRIQQGAAAKVFPLTAVFGQAGYYVADLVPTREGDYVWTFTGMINDDAINETFDTADGKIDSVQPISALEFPLTPTDAAQESQAVAAAQADAQTSRTLALVGIGVGILGVLGVFGVWLTRQRNTSTPATRSSSKGK